MAFIRIIGITSGGKQMEFKQIVEFSFQSDRFSPANSFSFTVLDPLVKLRIVKASALFEGKRLFDGIVDVQKTILDRSGRRMHFVCRSNSCLMLDNEVKPCLYEHYSANQLLRDHAVPYGIRGHLLPKNVVVKRILAHKGTSHWEFICLFCKLAYGKTPYIDRDGKLALTPLSDKQIRFSNKNGIRYTSAEICEDRYRIISELHVKTGRNDNGTEYNHVITNKVAKTLGIERERYYHPGLEWEQDIHLSATDRMREEQLDYQEITLFVPGMLDIYVGDQALFADELGDYGELYVAQVKIEGKGEGMVTRVKLWDQRILDS